MTTLYLTKRYSLYLFLSVAVILTLCSFLDLLRSGTVAGKVIIVDAGHGGIDPGANRPGVAEKDINLAVALQLKETLNQRGAKVVLTRQSDVELSGDCDNEKVRGRYRKDLAARLELVEESDADLFVSIHANAAANASRRGAEAFYYAKSAAGKGLADAILAELRKITRAGQEAKRADFFVLRRNQIPAALIEIGYITNPEERLLLSSPEYQRQVAEAITQGIVNHYQQ